MKPTTIQNAEVTICGCTFIVSYRYYEGIPEDSLNPADPPDVEIISVRIKGQPEGDADELLEAIKLKVRTNFNEDINFDNGYDLIESHIKLSHQQIS